MQTNPLFDSDLAEIMQECGDTCTLMHGGASFRLQAAISAEAITDGGFLSVDAGAASASATFRRGHLPTMPRCGDTIVTDTARYRVVSVDTQGGDAAVVCGLVEEGLQ